MKHEHPPRWKTSLLIAVEEYILKRQSEGMSYAERELEGRGVIPLLQGDDGLPGDARPVSQLLLRHFALMEAQGTDMVADKILPHPYAPFR